jgi:endoglucanase
MFVYRWTCAYCILSLILVASVLHCDARSKNFSSQEWPVCYPQLEDGDLPVEMHRGINIGNALEAPNEGDWGVYIKDEYFRIIREAGFDTVRIPIRWSNHAGSSPPYKIEDSFFRRVDWVINRSLEQGLVTIINIHHYDEIMQNPAGQKDRFISIWEQISERYKSYPEKLCFELLNEPNGALTSSIWNELVEEAVEVIRRSNPTRAIIVGPTDWNSVYKLGELMIPVNDRNIVVTFHLYTPFEFTHQGAEWVEPSPPVGRRWTGTELEKGQIANELDIAIRWAREHKNASLLLGEFGAYSKADMASRVRWTHFVAREAERRNIAWCYWEFCSGFGAYDPVKNEWRKDLLNALIPPPGEHYVSVDTEYGSVSGSGWYKEGSYAIINMGETNLGFLVQDVFDHFEGLGPRDRVVDARTVEVFVDGPKMIRAVWRKDYTRVLLLTAGLCLVVGVVSALHKRRRSSR